MVNNELYHWGIKGMKWGVRRYRNNDGTLTNAGRKRYSSKKPISEDYKRAHKKTDVKYMSDKELRDVNNRLQMEKQYTQLTEKKKSAGRKFVTGVLVASATAVATKYATKHMESGVQWVAKSLRK